MENMTYPIDRMETPRNDVYQRFAQYQEQWIALTANEEKMIAYSSDPLEVVRHAQSKGIEKPLYVYIPRWDIHFAPACRL